MAHLRPSYILLLGLIAGCAASHRVEELERPEPLIYSGGSASLYAEQDGAEIGSIRAGDTVDVVATVVNEDTGELVYYLVDRNGSRARVRAPLLRRDTPQPGTRIDSTSSADSIAQTIFTDGKGLRYYIDPNGQKVYVKEPEPAPKPKPAKKQKSKGKKKKK